MSLSRLTETHILQISGFVADYINVQRHKALPHAEPLAPSFRSRMHNFFLLRLLQTVRILVLAETRIDNPPFYALMRQMGFTHLPEFSQLPAMTFDDAIVFHEPVTDARLFHQLVHAEQFRQLGVGRFTEFYMRGFVAYQSIDEVPLERNARVLADRYARNPRSRFSVEREVATLIRDGRI